MLFTLIALPVAGVIGLNQADAGPGKGTGKGSGVRILDPTFPHFGTTYNDLAMAWWDWALNQPPESNPVTDETGEFCHVGQDEDYGQGSKIFFLAGSFGSETVRECTIPRGKALFFPIVNNFWVNPEECPTTDECRQLANGIVNGAADLACSINGVPVEDLHAYRAQSPPGGSPLHIREGGLLESFDPEFYVPRGYLPGSVADGYWLLVELPQNEDQHEIEFSAKLPEFEFELSVKYILTFSDDHDD